MKITAAQELTDLLTRLLHPFHTDPTHGLPHLHLEIESAANGTYTLIEEGRFVAGFGTPIGTINEVITKVNKTVVGRLRDLAVHAGVVGRGRSILAFPAGSGAGKSTLTAACLLSGFDYWSDEALVFTPVGEVLPYPRPISLMPRSRSLLGLDVGTDPVSEIALTAGDLGSANGVGTGTLAHVVTLERRSGPASLGPRPRSHTITALLGNAFNHYRRPEAAYRLTVDLAVRCQSWHLVFDDPLEAARELKVVVSGD